MPQRWLVFAGSPLLFAISGAAGRYLFQMVESRYQILMFLALASALQLAVSHEGPNRPFWLIAAKGAANWGAAAVAIVAVKWHLEGVSPIVLRLLA